MKKYLLTLALMICAGTMVIMADDISSAKRELNAAKKELSSAISKRDKAQQKQEQLQVDFAEALAQIEANQEKPKSLPYKNAVKKSETLRKKIEQNASELESLEQEISSLTQVVAELETALQNAEQAKEDAKQAKVEEKAAKKQAKEEERIAKQLAKDSAKIAKEREKEQKQRPSEQESSVAAQEESYRYTSEDNYSNTPSQSTSHQSSSNEGGDWPQLLIILGLLVLGAILWWFDFKKKHHCPNCGKWFTLESEGDTRKYEHDSRGNITRRGAKKHYRCTHCGHPVQFIEWFSNH